MIGNVGHMSLSASSRRAVEDFWEYAAFVANSLIFLLIGIRLERPAYHFFWLSVSIAIGVVLIGRALAIYPLSLVFLRSSLRLKLRHQHILFWGGCAARSRWHWRWDYPTTRRHEMKSSQWRLRWSRSRSSFRV
jgi:CPA1 family monovalent cation:H+ antiporter